MYPHLNPNQQQAVLHQGGPLLILAGAGSGKTRVITYRIVELLKRGVPAHRILAVTFTNKAAQEMKHRIEQLIPQSTKGLWIGTFHSVCSRLLRVYAESAALPKDFLIFDEQDQKNICAQILKELHLSENITPRAILSAIDQAKNRGQTPDKYWGKDYFTDLVSKVYPIYQKRLREASALDFGDLLLIPLELIKTNPTFAHDLGHRFDHILVDEFQDVNQVQYELVRFLAHTTKQLFVVGDDDQAIYSWRGADVKNILRFETDWANATVIKLEQNYRSTPIILDAANAVIARNRNRFGKQLVSQQKGGANITYHVAWDERREAAFVVKTVRKLISSENVPLSECAILYRTNAQSRLLEEALRAANLSYTIVGGMRFYDRAEIRDLLAYLRLCHNAHDEVALRRIINVPARGIGESTLEKIGTYARSHDVSYWNALQALLSEEKIFTSTIKKKVSLFISLIEGLQQRAKTIPLSSLAETILVETGYLESLAYESAPEATSRKENILELIQSIRDQEQEQAPLPLSLSEYLEKISLLSSSDTQASGISLMTIHASKGLEFQVVFITGLEEGLFPSIRTQEEENPNALEEERRLAYVAITRAKKHLFLSYAQQRRLYGQLPRINEPSRFLSDIPSQALTFLPPEESSASSFSHYREEEFNGFGSKSIKGPNENSSYSIEYDEQPSTTEFYVGQQVEHPQFGRGHIQSLSGFGERLKFTVNFNQGGTKTILSKFVKVI